MAEPGPDIDYAVLVTERRGGYELRIQELLLTVRGPDLQKAYDELMRRKLEIIEAARVFGTLDEVPPAARPALFDAPSRGLFGRFFSKI